MILKKNRMKSTLFVKSQLTFPLISVYACLFVTSLLFLSFNHVDGNKTTINIGAIIDVDLRSGKEERTAMEIAVQDFNSNSKSHQLSLHVLNHTGGDAIQASYAAEELIKNKKVAVILGMETWGEAFLVADIGTRYQVPVVSFIGPETTPPLASRRWPFLVRMGSNGTEQIQCIASIVHYYNWRRVVTILEDDLLGSESGNLGFMYKTFQEIGSEIEYQLVLPPFSSLSSPKEFVHEELFKVLTSTESRVFIVLKSSLPMLTNLFGEAKKMGLIGRDTVWILGENVANLLDSFDGSIISSMEGSIGIRTYYDSTHTANKEFQVKFRREFPANFPDEDDFQPGIHALRAYDGIRVVAQAMDGTGSNASSPSMLLQGMLRSNFTGLSGEISFEEGQLSHASTLRIVNVVGKKYKELDFWLPNVGFSKTEIGDGDDTIEGLSGPPLWPGDLTMRDPKGWAMPVGAKPLRIIVPKRTSFETFVTFPEGKTEPEGFCIDLFNEVLGRLNYSLPHEFFDHDGLYDDMIQGVYDKTYDAIVGDVTILAERTKYVEFTQPYAESGLSMIVRVKPEDSTWIFTKPFDLAMWVVSAVIFVYTMIVVWSLEHISNPEFGGSFKEQFGTILWFTFSSLFFAHKEQIKSNLTRVVVLVWLSVVFILTSSYTASLTSMLTVRRMEPNFSEFESLRKEKLNVGCDNDSFVKTYLENVLKFERDKIKIFDSVDDYTAEFESNNIAAAFLELPYEKVFLSQYCKSYATTHATYRFGGFGFAFRKGSPIAADFSRVILLLSEDGTLKSIEEKWFAPLPECSADSSSKDNSIESLSLQSFWGLYIVSASTSTICFLIFLIRIRAWNKIPGLASYLNGDIETRHSSIRRVATLGRTRALNEWNTSKWEYVHSSSDHESENPQENIALTKMRASRSLV